jgi:hypothetical protein
MVEILKFAIFHDATRSIKVKTALLGRKNGCKIPIIEIVYDEAQRIMKAFPLIC